MHNFFYFQVVAFLLFAIIIMVVCGCGALIGGVRYWMDGWQLAKRSYDDSKCEVVSNVCMCNKMNMIPFAGTLNIFIRISS